MKLLVVGKTKKHKIDKDILKILILEGAKTKGIKFDSLEVKNVIDKLGGKWST